MSETYPHCRPIWLDEDLKVVKVIDQRCLPHKFVVSDLKTVDDVVKAIKEMVVRGAPLIGVTGAFGVYLATLNSPDQTIEKDYLIKACNRLKSARPTAVNLKWAVDRVLQRILSEKDDHKKIVAARTETAKITAEEVENCRNIGEYGVRLIDEIRRRKKGQTVNLLTHCNAGYLACIEYGTATAPIYAAYDKGIDIHVWVDETRPLNQGARLTAWELAQHGVKHTIVVDSAAGYLMQRGKVDMIIVGTDRTTCTGDVANKIGTYPVALAAKDNQIPFYVALPSSTFDWSLRDGLREISIEERDPDEIRFIHGLNEGQRTSILVPAPESPARNFAFDITPARLITGLITERGVCKATEQDIRRLFPEK
jgi:methylthioribose-1-phosphate isomerase